MPTSASARFPSSPLARASQRMLSGRRLDLLDPSSMLDAARAKARRGALRIPVPVGYIWHREVGLGFDPDLAERARSQR
jgi:hypothetical protein